VLQRGAHGHACDIAIFLHLRPVSFLLSVPDVPAVEPDRGKRAAVQCPRRIADAIEGATVLDIEA